MYKLCKRFPAFCKIVLSPDVKQKTARVLSDANRSYVEQVALYEKCRSMSEPQLLKRSGHLQRRICISP